MVKILRINTRERTFTLEEAGDYAGLGGRALTSRIVNREVPADCHPLSAENKLIFAPGVLTGTKASSSGRISVGAKSPLTGGIKESNSGGVVSRKLAKLNLAAIVLEDKPERDAPFMVVRVDKDGVTIEDAPAVGKGNYEYAKELDAKYGGSATCALIGPAGEQCLKSSTIQFTDMEGRPARSAGRGGMGAVMGSKRVKAVIVDDSGAGNVEYSDPDAFTKASKRWAEIIREHAITSQALPTYGTAVLVNIINEAGALPTKNFREGRFDRAADVSGEKLHEIIEARGGKTREGCHVGCAIQCSQQYLDEKGEYVTSGFEYETLWAMGPNTTISDMDDIARLDRACDDMGLDTIEMGNTIAMAMEGGLIPWGDGPAALKLIEAVGEYGYLGKLVGNGTTYMADAYGVDRIPVVKNQALPAYDPRAVKGIGVTYSTTPQGADHTAGYAVCQNVLSCGGDVDPHSKEGQVELSKTLQIATNAVDSAGFCLFVAFAVLDTEDALQVIADMVAAKAGVNFTPDDIMALGKQVLDDEVDFNRRAGFSEVDDQLPRFFRKQLPPHNVTWDFEYQEMQAVKA
ncbi:aldehyde ferredoxin oxidoreductase family protein [Desulfohalovibrio reitneri]|uniref:aldehyde ferredoxin oxidoreductase family protein n=1 Tax=Desulfohalovibrio reitneri TaxID=1307759 RepID=UPI0004A77B94|nr:aldehyde ferredoxin oxidoreductase C-terminal domain-containing protein [Desulfohalovibrio reitneri]